MAGRGTTDEDFIADEQLTLAGEDERLPWLESGEEDDEETGVDTGRIVGFAMFAALALAALVVGIWWFGQRGSEPELVADGSTIPAPPGPYKTRPTDPGGKTFEGTGNLAPAVGEGKETEGRIAESNVPVPSIDTPKPGETPTPAASAAAPSGGVPVQVGAIALEPQPGQPETEHTDEDRRKTADHQKIAILLGDGSPVALDGDTERKAFRMTLYDERVALVRFRALLAFGVCGNHIAAIENDANAAAPVAAFEIGIRQKRLRWNARRD